MQVECQNEAEAMEAGAAGADIVMLDNTTDMDALEASAGRIKHIFPRIVIEASGVK